MIKVKRHENTRKGTYSCYYYCNGKEIAMYLSEHDCVFCRTEFIEHDWKKPVYERALNGAYKEAYAELFGMLNIDEKSKMSEYMNG